jgi:aspartyl/asparaginyl-tRNA synthetase
MIPDFNENGYLPPGIHEATMEDFRIRFVDDVEESITRCKVFAGYTDYCRDMLALDILIKQWLDGSFTTRKIDPNDMDVISHVDALKINNKYTIDQFQRLIIKEDHSNRRLLNSKYKCDPFAIAVYPPEHKFYKLTIDTINYWQDFFGHDSRVAGKPPKGLIEINQVETILEDKYARPDAR